MKAAANSVLLSQTEIQARVAEIAREISQDYAGRPLTVIGVLKGSFIFVADLVRQIDPSILIEIDFIATSSYGSSTTSSGEVRIVRDVGVPVEGKDLLVVEDIVDSGRTLTHVIALLSSRGARSVRIATLLEKPDSSKYCGDLHYVGFRIPSRFVVGYGLDYAEHYRNLSEIRILDES
jgi:hypoxanthine phosphoribosyltransferase